MTSLIQAFLIICSICIPCYILISGFVKAEKEKILGQVKSNWGKEKTIYRNFDLISMYLDRSSKHKLNEKTISDLNINDLYSKIDRCQSKIGQQYLYYILGTPTNDIEVLKRRKKLIDLFSTENDLRISIEYLLAKLNQHVDYSLSRAFYKWEFKPLKNKILIAVLGVLPIILLGLGIFVSHTFYLLIFVSFLINLIFHYKHKSEVELFIAPFSQIGKLRDCAIKISKLNLNFDVPDVKQACTKLSSLVQYQYLLTSENQEQNSFSSAGWLLVEYLKITFLIEANLLNKCLKLANSLQNDVQTLYRFIGLTDACISIASYRTGLETYCEPVFTNDNAQISIEGAYHPLIEDCVPNNLITKEKGILITGSNMSGKTTFIRTVAINAILAQTVYIVCADSYKSSFLNVFSSIGIRDDLMLGKSYYLEEIESIYSLIEEAKTLGRNNLFVVDELFKGTNTIERIAAAKAVLQYLISEKSIVIVSTHDMELAKLLCEEYDLFHFEESVSITGLEFDHKIKTGILKTRNAIRLLELFEFPKEIIDSANSHIDSLFDLGNLKS